MWWPPPRTLKPRPCFLAHLLSLKLLAAGFLPAAGGLSSRSRTFCRVHSCLQSFPRSDLPAEAILGMDSILSLYHLKDTSWVIRETTQRQGVVCLPARPVLPGLLLLGSEPSPSDWALAGHAVSEPVGLSSGFRSLLIYTLI